jgi:hypothetical protein
MLSDINDAFVAEKTGGVRIVDARQRYLGNPASRSKYDKICHPPVVLPACGKLIAALPVL